MCNENAAVDCRISNKNDQSVRADVGKQCVSLAENAGQLKEMVELPLQISRNLCQKYRPKRFEELIGQNAVIKTLSNAIIKREIASVYLFHGSRGTGKTSAARIFASALNCMASTDMRPCTVCKQCTCYIMGKGLGICEVDAASYNNIANMNALLQAQTKTLIPDDVSHNVVIIDECHILNRETWEVLLKFLEEPPKNLVFILITTAPSRLPHAVFSRCHKFQFLKIKHFEIVGRLFQLVNLEKLDVEPGALDLIASKSDGSLRDAEMILDQLSLSDQIITQEAVVNLVGLDFDEQLLGLLDVALCSNTKGTVQRVRELVDSGIEPLELMSKMAALITEILAGSYISEDKGRMNSLFYKHTCSEGGLERLRCAHQILLEAEKQLKLAPPDSMVWLTAALLQFGPKRPLAQFCAAASIMSTPLNYKGYRSNNLPPTRAMDMTKLTINQDMHTKECQEHNNDFVFKCNCRVIKPYCETRVHPLDSVLHNSTTEEPIISSFEESSNSSVKESEDDASFIGPGNFRSFWSHILKRCRPLRVRHFLHYHGNLLGVCFSSAEAVVHLEFRDPEHKAQAQRYKESILAACKKALGNSINVKVVIDQLEEGVSEQKSYSAINKKTAGDKCFMNLKNAVTSDPQEKDVFYLQAIDYQKLHDNVSQTSEMIDDVTFSCNSLSTSKVPPTTLAVTRNRTNVEKLPMISQNMQGRISEVYKFPTSHKPHPPGHSETVFTGEILSPRNARNLNEVHSQIPSSTFSVEKQEAAYNLESKIMVPQMQSNYDGILCWRAPETGRQDKKVRAFRQMSCLYLSRSCIA